MSLPIIMASALLLLGSFTASVSGDASEAEPFLGFISAIDPKHMLRIKINDLMLSSCFNQGDHQNRHNRKNRQNRAKSDLVGKVGFGLNKRTGVRCNRGAIVEIRLENSNLSGKIDADSICKLSNLRVLNLARNSIHGGIPDSIIHCKKLTNLNLSFNNLSGKVPFALHKLSHLKKLDISNNQFKKEFKFGNSLKSQATTQYSTGKLQVKFDTSVSQSPESSTSFSQSPTSTSVSQSPVSPSLEVKMSNDGEAHGLHHGWLKWLIAALVAAVFIVFSFFMCKRVSAKLSSKKKQNEKPPQKSPVVNQPATSSKTEQPEREAPEFVFFDGEDDQFTLEDLLEATADLRNHNICSSLFKVVLKNKHYAVKTLRKMEISLGEFRRILRLVGNLTHPNILPLVGYYSANEEKLLIYRYQRNGSLQDLLDNSIEGKRVFPWRLRVSIASGIARGLSFIHQTPNTQDSSIPHGNLKPSNILLNENNEPQISEYGITKFLDPKRAHLVPSKGYRAPEKRRSEKGDVFSFGVMLLELLTGKSVVRSGMNLPKWVRAKVSEEWTCEVFDEEVGRNAERWAFSLLMVAMDCVAEGAGGRPTAAEAAERVEEVARAVEDFEPRASFSDSDATPSPYQ